MLSHVEIAASFGCQLSPPVNAPTAVKSFVRSVRLLPSRWMAQFPASGSVLPGAVLLSVRYVPQPALTPPWLSHATLYHWLSAEVGIGRFRVAGDGRQFRAAEGHKSAEQRVGIPARHDVKEPDVQAGPSRRIGRTGQNVSSRTAEGDIGRVSRIAPGHQWQARFPGRQVENVGHGRDCQDKSAIVNATNGTGYRMVTLFTLV